MRTRDLAAVAAAALGVACHSAAPAEPAAPDRDVQPAAEPGPGAKAAADTIVHVFDLLTSTSVMIGDHTKIAAAGVEGLGFTAPIPWTTDVSKDKDLMRGAVRAIAMRGQLPPSAVLRSARAMALASGDAQTFAVNRAGLQALYGLVAGVAVVQLGLVVHQADDGRWAASDVLPGGAAQAVGIQRGDVIVSIDGTPITHGWRDFAYLLGAARGTQAKLVVERGGATRMMTARPSPVAGPILDARVLPDGTGYVRIWTCTHSDDPHHDAAALLGKALADFEHKRVKKLVVDLRGNAGGFPFDLASLLVDGDPLLYSLPADGPEAPIARGKLAPLWKQPIAVLVDEATASGAEMLALALRDHAHAQLVGRPTAGGLTFPTAAQLPGDITLSYPEARVGNKDKAPQDGNRLQPDVAVPNPTAADYAAHRDPQLTAALAALATAS